MALPIVTPNSTPDELLAGLNAYIDTSLAHLAKQEYVELAGMDHVVEALCTRIQNMSVADSRPYAEALDALGLRLDALQTRMVEAQDTLRKEIARVTNGAKAAKAYGKEGQ